ncbi:MAG TPA: hypothetical protein VMV92_41565 [Streptosporangiaceae bacterium]|nr:hypothetical protein [Streptosporangiaceae bacterium]
MTGAATTPVPQAARRRDRDRAVPAGALRPAGHGADAETAHEAAVRIAADLPPLTDQQRDRLAALLGTVRPATPRRRPAAA